jgi:hypothetical protein
VWDEDSSGDGDDYDCAADRAAKDYGTTFIRYYEDSTWVSYMAEPTGEGAPAQITAAETAAMTACGVNLFGFDQLHPQDPRLEALVWSWARDGWRGGPCAFAGADTRFHAGDCGVERAFACRNPATGAWSVSSERGPWADGGTACSGADAFNVPATGWENTGLATAVRAAGVGEVWLNYGRLGETWTPRPIR